MLHHWVTEFRDNGLVPASGVKINRKNSLTVEGTSGVIFITYDLHVSAGRIEVFGPWALPSGPGAILKLCLFIWIWQGFVRFTEEPTIQGSRPMCL